MKGAIEGWKDWVVKSGTEVGEVEVNFVCAGDNAVGETVVGEAVRETEEQRLVVCKIGRSACWLEDCLLLRIEC